MTAQDDTPSVDDDALASALQTNTGQGEEAAGSSAAPAQDAGREGRIRELIHQKQVADAVAARSAAEAAALRNGSQAPGRPQDYRAPEDYTRAIAEQAAREVGASLMARQSAQAQEMAAKAAQDAWSETTAEFRQRVPDFDAVAHNPNLAVTPIMADAIREFEPGRGDRLLPWQEPGRGPADRGLAARLAGDRDCEARRPARRKRRVRQPRASARGHAHRPRRQCRQTARRHGLRGIPPHPRILSTFNRSRPSPQPSPHGRGSPPQRLFGVPSHPHPLADADTLRLQARRGELAGRGTG